MNTVLRPRNLMLRPRGLVLRPRKLTLRPRSIILMSRGLILRPRMITLRPRNTVLMPRVITTVYLRPRSKKLGAELGEVKPFPPKSVGIKEEENMRLGLSVFGARGRKTTLSCPKRNGRDNPIDFCIHDCEGKCRDFTVKNIMKPGESLSRFMDDWIKIQRLVNIAYGTVVQKRLKTQVLEPGED